MKKTAYIIFIHFFLATNLFAQINLDTTKRIVPEITYKSLDSIIKTNDYTAIYFWPTWCAPCIKHIPEIIDIMKNKNNISLLFVNDANSKHTVSKRLVDYPETISGYYRIEALKPKNYKIRKIIQVNDLEQIRLFNEHFTHQTAKRDNERSPAFFLFDKNGMLLWYNKTLLTVDMIRLALEDFK